MGNKLSCSCAPLIKKNYRYEDSPWQANTRPNANSGRISGSGERRPGDTGHILRCGSLRERKRCALIHYTIKRSLFSFSFFFIFNVSYLFFVCLSIYL